MMMAWQETKLHLDWEQAQYEDYLSGLNIATAHIAYATQAAAHHAVVFGVDVEKLRQMKFSESDIRAMEIQHDRYQRGDLRPKPGSDTAFFIAIVEGIAGGIPRPEQEPMIMPRVIRMLANMVRNGHDKRDAIGRPTKNPFVQISDQNAKRRKFLDDLDSLGGPKPTGG